MKKLLALLMATLMLLSLVACNNNDESDITLPMDEEVIIDDSIENDIDTPDEEAVVETDDVTSEEAPAETPDSTPVAKPENKPASKPENTPAAKPETKPEAAPEAKPEAAPDAKPEEKPQAGSTTGGTMLSIFRANKDKSPEEIANACLADKSIQFFSMTAPMEEGFFAEFDGDVKGFDSCVKFGPAMGSIAFSGFVFEVSGDATAFANDLKSRANPRWNICVEADETVCEVYGNKVFFLMCPSSLEA